MRRPREGGKQEGGTRKELGHEMLTGKVFCSF
jgi:hypothetical protein